MNTRIPRGFGLIETMVTIAILAILLSIAVPSYQQMIANGRTRTLAESFRAGVDLARAEAMRRNLPVTFAIVSGGCTASASATSWVVFRGSACSDETVIQRFDGGGAGATVSSTSSRTQITFGGMGMASGTNPITQIDFSNNLATGKRDLRLTISSGGQTRLCEPGVATGDPRAC